jgi:hypothetical protein
MYEYRNVSLFCLFGKAWLLCDSIHSLAMVLGRQDGYKGAEKIPFRALEGCEKVLRLEHPDIESNGRPQTSVC